MPFTIAAFVTRKPEISPADFEAAYESTHIPALKEAVGDAYPQTVARYYVRRAKSDPQGLTPLSFTGSEETFGYDLVSHLTFADEPAALEFQKKYAEAKESLAANVAGFAQLENFRVIAFKDAITN
ncbi:hypothetical protein BU24DRAFT_421550 [Aaosphaeria arxii CBS 175.79]|uniref:EthD domain-containing protein n=1 Tax=Aaosphaeria arxii CBS 175.79 TaxID=1450172 RepID=A0A6A5XQ13_9PLEO|nr:uncharacterized protein BU24DRAFT_421550 [Aaosphaeria arxii CBS 175.79]KAF2015242.1 hypothetical protein BU24DRAFT_421550 [Aaosphaeria arxii CBS 175.79]